MTPDEALQAAREGKVLPVYLVAGEEEFLRSAIVRGLRELVIAAGVPGLNDDHFVAGEASVDQVLGVARTLPMMARRRFVLVRSIERWEGRGSSDAPGREKSGRSRAAEPFERLADYAAAPAPETVLVLVASKLDGRRRLMSAARQQKWLVSCDPLARGELPRFVERCAASRGTRLAPGVADLIAELSGPELAAVADSVERLGLYAGDREITDEDVGECLVRLRTKTVWELVDAVARRDLAAALAALDEVFDPNDRSRLVGLLAWSARQLLRFEAAIRAGMTAPDAAKAAKAPPFKARELAEQTKRIPRAELESWLETLAEVDLALKGGSRRPPKAVFEHALVRACSAPGRASVRATDRGA